jgi:hypothetical protein
MGSKGRALKDWDEILEWFVEVAMVLVCIGALLDCWHLGTEKGQNKRKMS